MSQKHSDYSPSRLHRIIACPGSVDLIKTNNIQVEASSYAKKGTELHDHTFKLLNDNTKPNGLDLDDLSLVQDCVDYFELTHNEKDFRITGIGFEKLVRLESWGLPEVWGTTDAYIVDPLRRHLDVFDWKFGSGIQVFARENPQQMAYAAGITRWPPKLQIQDITLHIVQPALDHYDTWDLTIDELYDWVHTVLAKAIGESQSTPPIFNPGEEQCRFCEAAKTAQCEVLHQKAHLDAVKIFEHAKLKTSITPESIMDLLELFPLVEQVANGYRQFIMEEFNHSRGNQFPKFKLVRGRANRAWKDEKTVIDWLSTNTNIEELFNTKLLSPSQIEKSDKTLKKNKNFHALYEKPEGKLKLVSVSDKRPAVNTVSTAVEVFTDIEYPDILD